MVRNIVFLFIFCFCFISSGFGQGKNENRFRIISYNVENLYDSFNDSLTSDEEFLPNGIRGWTYGRMMDKIRSLSKVIIAAGEGDLPDIIGLYEVENYFVLNKLLKETPLVDFDYRIVHHDSPDPRGIDVAMLYRKDRFKVLKNYPVRIRFAADTLSRTRDILYVKGVVLSSSDTLHLFVNHWPSKYGGELETVNKRNAVALTLKNITDSLLAANSSANIIAMGDFNETANEEAVEKTLGACMDTVVNNRYKLYNMTATIDYKNKGTIKFREQWQCIDHIIVSQKLLKNTNHIHIIPKSFRIFDAPFLLQKDEVWFGLKPFRTFYGAKYQAGFSDHLPVIIDLTH